AAVINRKSPGLWVEGRPCLEDRSRWLSLLEIIHNFVGHVPEETIGNEFFRALEEEYAVLLCLERRSVADPPVLASNLEGVLPLHDGQIVFILKHSVCKELRQSARIAEAHPQGIIGRKNVWDSSRARRVGEVGTMAQIRCPELVENGR